MHSLDDSTLLALEGGAGGWPGQQQLLLVNQAVQQVFLAVVVINLQESQGGDRQPGQPRGPQSKLHRKQTVSERGKWLPAQCALYLPTWSLQLWRGERAH